MIREENDKSRGEIHGLRREELSRRYEEGLMDREGWSMGEETCVRGSIVEQD